VSAPLRILFVAPYVPSPVRVRPYEVIRHLPRLGHRVTLVVVADGHGDSPAPDTVPSELYAACDAVHVVPHPRWRAAANCLRALPTPEPLWAAYCRSPDMLRVVRDLAASGRFDVAHVEHLRAAFVAPALGGLPAVFDAVDCIADLQRQMKGFGGAAARFVAWEEWAKLRRYEPRAYARFDRIAVTTRHEAESLSGLAATAGVTLPPVTAIPNGVDLERFRPRPDVAPEPDTLVFSGKLSYRANDDAARFLLTDILPRVREKRPGARLLLVGAAPSPSLRALAARVGGVEVTRYVDDLGRELARARVAVCPLRIGVGIQNKALEAMAAGVPVVCTPLAGRALAGAPVTVAEDAATLADVTAALLALPEAEWRDASRRARGYVEANHRWEDIALRFEALYRDALAEPRRRGG
jgi:glycosyltransferase involved in cell wall biosynthesis